MEGIRSGSKESGVAEYTEDELKKRTDEFGGLVVRPIIDFIKVNVSKV